MSRLERYWKELLEAIEDRTTYVETPRYTIPFTKVSSVRIDPEGLSPEERALFAKILFLEKEGKEP